MAILTIIFGVIMVLSGASCFIAPVMTWVGTEYIALTVTAILMIVYGIIGIINAISSKEYGINMLFSILSIIAGAVMFIPGMRMAVGGAALYMAAVWFILKGLTTIFMALTLKGAYRASKRWIWGLIIGIIGVLLGVYSFIHPLIQAAAIGYLIAFFLVETGINMIIMGAAANE